MWGFGAPHSFGLPDVPTEAGEEPGSGGTIPVDTPYYDWGFGDPGPAGFPGEFIEEWGFGEPVPSQFLAYMASTSLVPDDGGVMIRLVGEWPIVGPYKIQLRHTTTDQEFPPSDQHWGCNAPLHTDKYGFVKERSQPYFCYTNFAQKEEGNIIIVVPGKYVEFALPPCPPGLYNVVVKWGTDALLGLELTEDPLIPSELAKFGGKWAASMNKTVVLENVLQVVYRGREAATYHVRKMFPPIFDPGPRGPFLEKPLGTTGDDYDG